MQRATDFVLVVQIVVSLKLLLVLHKLLPPDFLLKSPVKLFNIFNKLENDGLLAVHSFGYLIHESSLQVLLFSFLAGVRVVTHVNDPFCSLDQSVQHGNFRLNTLQSLIHFVFEF